MELSDTTAIAIALLIQRCFLTPQGDLQVEDSILLAEVLVAIEDETRVEIPMDETTARALRSVDSLAKLLYGLLSTPGRDTGVE